MTMTKLDAPVARVFKPLVEPARYKGAFGGRGSGKSHFFGERLVIRCVNEPGLRAVCIREMQKTLAQSSKRQIEQKLAEVADASAFRLLEARIITHGNGLVIFH